LMRASGVELDFEQRGWTEFLEDNPVGAGGAGVCGFVCRPRRTCACGVFGSREMASSMRPFFVVEFSLNEREIGFLNGARAEGFGKFGVSEIVFWQ